MESLHTLLNALPPGIVMGSVYALVAVGLTIIFGVLRIVNFAHGEFLMLGMYATLFLTQALHVNPYLLLPVNFLLFVGVGMIVQRTLMQRVLQADESVSILVTVGLMLVLQNGALMLWKSDFRTLRTPYQTATVQLPFISGGINEGKLIALVVSILAMVLLAQFISRSLFGTAIRALAQDREAARLIGMKADTLDTITFGLGTGLAAVAGTVLAVFYPVYPLVGLDFILKSFVIVVLGGMGSISGSLVGGLIIGVLESVSASFLPTGWNPLILYSLFVLMLLVRPQGLFGKVASR